MKNNSQINRPAILILLIVLLLILTLGTQVKAQQTPETPEPNTVSSGQKIHDAKKDLDDCSAMLSKAVDAFTDLQKAKLAVDAELVTNKDIIVKQDAYNTALLGVVKMLISSEKRDKSFFRKVLDGLEQVLKTATDPKTLLEIATLIIIARNLSR